MTRPKRPRLRRTVKRDILVSILSIFRIISGSRLVRGAAVPDPRSFLNSFHSLPPASSIQTFMSFSDPSSDQ